MVNMPLLECSRKHAARNATLGTGRAANRCQTQPASFPRQQLGNELRGTIYPAETQMDVTFLGRFHTGFDNAASPDPTVYRLGNGLPDPTATGELPA